MKALILAGIHPSTISSHIPLATALRNAGHQVMVSASIDEMIPVIVGVGLPALPVTEKDQSPEKVISGGQPVQIPEDPIERERLSGVWYARLEAATLDALLAFANDWHPDVIIGGVGAVAAPLLATRLGLPYVRQAWDIHDWELVEEGATDDLRDKLAELGLDGLPDPDLQIDITPPSLRAKDAAPAQMMRWIPANAQCRLEPWMYTRGERTRIGVTIGVGVGRYNQQDFLHDIVENISALDAEVVVPVTEDAAPALRERLTSAKVGWIPLDVLAPTCDLLVHHSGGNIMLTALTFGVPQILIPLPELYRAQEMARRIAEAGAGIVLSPQEATSDVIAKTCQEIISNPKYAAAAAAFAREIATMPLPSEVVRRIEWLVSGASR